MSASKRKNETAENPPLANKVPKTSIFHKVVTQRQVDEAVTNYIVRRNEPFTLVRDPHFIELIKTLQPSKHVMCYKTFKKNMDSDYDKMIKSLKGELAKQEFTALTTDGWSHVNKSFLGYCVTWLTEDFERKIAVIGLRRFHGSHTGKRLASHMYDVMCEWLIQNSCVGSTTDGASNYAKAFKDHGKVLGDDAHLGETVPPNEEGRPRIGHLSQDDPEDEEDDFENEPLDIESLLDNIDENDVEIHLSPHFKCASHKFNNIGRHDVKKALKDNNKYNSENLRWQLTVSHVTGFPLILHEF